MTTQEFNEKLCKAETAKEIADLLFKSADTTDSKIMALRKLGRFRDPSLRSYFLTYSVNQPSIVRKEAVSWLGALQDDKMVYWINELLKTEDDPKVICQCLRALKRFITNNDSDDPNVVLASQIVENFINHDNEIISKFAKQPSKQDRFTEVTTDVMPHPRVLDEISNLVIHGEAKEELSKLPEGCVHLTFTSPPYYNAKDYSVYPSYEAYLDQMTEIFKEVMRVTKEGRYFVLNTSPVIVPRISRAHSSKRYPIPFDLHARLTAMGWEFIDDIIWEKPESSVKNRVSQFRQHGKPLAYKPNIVTEYIMVYRKPTDKLVDWNIKQYTDRQVVDWSRVDLELYPDISSNVWHISPTSNKKHSAVFPTELCNRIIELYSYYGDVVLDPFAGSGTLGYTADWRGRKFLMIEQNKEYFDYIVEQCKKKGMNYQTNENF